MYTHYYATKLMKHLPHKPQLSTFIISDICLHQKQLFQLYIHISSIEAYTFLSPLSSWKCIHHVHILKKWPIQFRRGDEMRLACSPMKQGKEGRLLLQFCSTDALALLLLPPPKTWLATTKQIIPTPLYTYIYLERNSFLQ